MVKNIKKRDGRVKPFDKSKITIAIAKAMNECGVNDVELAEIISTKIANSDQVTLEVEQVQDMVETELMNSDYKNVAKAFIVYRNERSKIREKNSELNKTIEDIIMCKNVQNSNANLNEESFGGRKFESSNALHKYIALNSLIRPEVAEAYRNNDLYIHDLSDYDIGDHNCLFIDFQHLFKHGFKTRNGDVRPPRSFATACQQVAVIIQIQSQS